MNGLQITPLLRAFACIARPHKPTTRAWFIRFRRCPHEMLFRIGLRSGDGNVVRRLMKKPIHAEMRRNGVRLPV